MSDAERIDALEKKLNNVQAELARLAATVVKLADSAERRRQTIEALINDHQKAFDLIFGNVEIPNVRWRRDLERFIE